MLVLKRKRRRSRKLMTKCLTGGETHLKKAKGGKKTKRKAKAEAGLGRRIQQPKGIQMIHRIQKTQRILPLLLLLLLPEEGTGLA